MKPHVWASERCNGPDRKMIFRTKNEALAALRRRGRGKHANPHQGKVYPCPWGDHYHYSSKRNPGRK